MAGARLTSRYARVVVDIILCYTCSFQLFVLDGEFRCQLSTSTRKSSGSRRDAATGARTRAGVGLGLGLRPGDVFVRVRRGHRAGRPGRAAFRAQEEGAHRRVWRGRAAKTTTRSERSERVYTEFEAGSRDARAGGVAQTARAETRHPRPQSVELERRRGRRPRAGDPRAQAPKTLDHARESPHAQDARERGNAGGRGAPEVGGQGAYAA